MAVVLAFALRDAVKAPYSNDEGRDDAEIALKRRRDQNVIGSAQQNRWPRGLRAVALPAAAFRKPALRRTGGTARRASARSELMRWMPPPPGILHV